MHHFYRVSPGSISHLMEDFRRALSDPDPGVMEAALILLYDVIKVSIGFLLIKVFIKVLCAKRKTATAQKIIVPHVVLINFCANMVY